MKRDLRSPAVLARATIVAALLALAGCDDGGPSAPPPPPPATGFPAGFLFGTAIAGFQADMGCPTIPASECEDPASDWYVYVTHPELVADPALALSGDPPSAGPGFYELYPQDLDRVKDELANGALRLSIEWSRVFPTSTAGIEGHEALRQAANPAAIAYYHAVFAAMRARGVTPFVTLNHYTLPSWIHDAYGCHVDLDACTARGWLDREGTVREIAKYAGFVAKEFGGEVDLWATLNEPFIAVVVAGYVFPTPERTHPPAVTLRNEEARTATLAEIEGHARMYDAVKAADTLDADGDGRAARVGIVYNLQPSAPKTPGNALDEQAARSLSYLMNDVFLEAVVRGDVDERFDGNPVHREDLAGRMDFLGVNYYARAIVEGLDGPMFPSLSPLLTANLLTMELDWDYDQGLHDVLLDASKYGVPLFVSETGAADPADDGRAEAWLVRTLSWTKRAIEDGAPVEGYFYWTLLDNYEWNHGMGVRMGLYAVDPADPSKARRARRGVASYARIATARDVPEDLAAKFPID